MNKIPIARLLLRRTFMVKSILFLATSLLLSLPLPLLFAEPPRAAEPRNTQRDRTLWIGTTCSPATAALRAQLSIPAGQGLLVRDVVRDSPAAAAGIEENDLLLEANKESLSRPRDLVRIVTHSEGKPIGITLMRSGQQKSVTVTPRSRANRPRGRNLAGVDRPLLREWIDQLVPSTPGQRNNQGLQRLGPGLGEFLGNGELLANLPDNVQIVLGGKEGQPLKFVIEKDGEKWEVDANDLDGLSGKFLPLLEQMLGPDVIPASPIDPSESGLPDVESPGIQLPTVELPTVKLPTEEPAEALRRTEDGTGGSNPTKEQ